MTAVQRGCGAILKFGDEFTNAILTSVEPESVPPGGEFTFLTDHVLRLAKSGTPFTMVEGQRVVGEGVLISEPGSE